ncbi:MAG TPA: NrsF family protein [Acetobacteraceae bacterium]|nr:NrsF family protein [Rhodocyclaceae bacterium]HUZ62372.1 NrsF family protein [Acetobacteraceae bacterium]
METERLIDCLAGDLTPVRRLPPPSVRLGTWLLVSLPAVALVAWGSGLRPDLASRLADPRFLLEEAAALLTSLVGAYAALCALLPDQPGWKLWLPLAPMALWLGSLGQQCLEVVLRFGPAGLRVTSDAMCLPAIALGGLVPAIAIVVLLRRARGFRTTHACFCGALGAAALGATALRLYHPQDAAIMVIVWQLGSVALLSLVAGGIGRLLVRTSEHGHLA